MWAGRILLESTQHLHSAFITLTYNEQTVPRHPVHHNMTLSKRDMQLFLMRLRKNTPKAKIRYFLCGEYGSGTGRPHYHLILFGLHFTQTAPLLKAWNQGFVSSSEINTQRARYVAKYTTKLVNGSLESPFRQKEFALQSRKPPLGHAILPHVAKAALKSPSPEVPSLIRIGPNRFKLDYFTQSKLSRLMQIPILGTSTISKELHTEVVITLGDPLKPERHASTLKADKYLINLQHKL